MNLPIVPQRHNETYPFKTGDVQLTNAIVKDGVVMSYVSDETIGTFTLPASVYAENIKSVFSYQIYLPAERTVYVILVKMSTTEYRFYEYGGSNASGWTLFLTLGSGTYAYQSIFNAKYVNYSVKQFTAFVNNTTKKYTLLFIHTNVGVFKYGYVAHSVAYNTASAYYLDCTGWYVFDTLLNDAYQILSYTGQDLFMQVSQRYLDEYVKVTTLTTIPAHDTNLGTGNFSNLVLDVAYSTAGSPTFAQNEKIVNILVAYESIDGNITFPQYSEITNLVNTSGTTYDYLLSFVMNLENSAHIKKTYAYLKNIHFFVRIVNVASKGFDSLNISFSEFKLLFTVSMVEENVVNTDSSMTNSNGKFYRGTAFNHYAGIAISPGTAATDRFYYKITDQTIGSTDLVSFLGYNIALKTNLYNAAGTYINTFYPGNLSTVFKDIYFVERINSFATTEIMYQNIYSFCSINNRNFVVNNKNEIYYTGFNGFGAANYKLFLSGNILVLQEHIDLQRLDLYQENLILFGTQGVSALRFGDNFPATALAINNIKNVKVYPELCRTIKNIAFVFTDRGIFSNSENLLTDTYNALPTLISKEIEAYYLAFIAATTKSVVVNENDQILLLHYDLELQSVAFSLKYMHWFRITHARTVSTNKIPAIQTYLNSANNIVNILCTSTAVGFILRKIKFKENMVMEFIDYTGSDDTAVSMSQVFYISSKDILDFFTKISYLQFNINHVMSSTISVNIAYSLNMSDQTGQSLATFTLGSTELINNVRKFFVQSQLNALNVEFYKITFTFTNSDSTIDFQIQNLFVNFQKLLQR